METELFTRLGWSFECQSSHPWFIGYWVENSQKVRNGFLFAGADLFMMGISGYITIGQIRCGDLDCIVDWVNGRGLVHLLIIPCD